MQTQFFIASVSKSFTAAAIMQLVEAGEINLDTPVQTYLPEFTLSDPNTAAQITIRHLLTHTFNAITSAEALQTATHLAQGHLMAFGIPFAAPEMMGFLGGSGGVISTAEDMAHYLIWQSNGGRFKDTQLLSPQSMALMHTPPQNVHSSYGMGWFAMKENGKPVLEHNGILSTFYTDVVLLPQDKYGIVLLYNISSMPLIAIAKRCCEAQIASPQIKRGLTQLLTDGQPTSRGMSIDLWSISIGILTLIGVGLAIRSLLRLRHWKQARHGIPLWRSLLSLSGMFFPGVLLLALPWLLSLQSDRVFSYAMLYRAMPDVMIWLSVCALLGVINGTLFLSTTQERQQN